MCVILLLFNNTDVIDLAREKIRRMDREITRIRRKIARMKFRNPPFKNQNKGTRPTVEVVCWC